MTRVWTSSTSTSGRGGPAIRGGRTTSPTGGCVQVRRLVLGLPIGDYPHSRPPQAQLPPEAKAQIENAYLRLGLIDARDERASPSRNSLFLTGPRGPGGSCGMQYR